MVRQQSTKLPRRNAFARSSRVLSASVKKDCVVCGVEVDTQAEGDTPRASKR